MVKKIFKQITSFQVKVNDSKVSVIGDKNCAVDKTLLTAVTWPITEKNIPMATALFKIETADSVTQ